MEKLHCVVIETPKRITDGKFSEKESYHVNVQYDDNSSECLVVVPELYDSSNGAAFSIKELKQGTAFNVSVKRIKLKDGTKHALAWEICKYL